MFILHFEIISKCISVFRLFPNTYSFQNIICHNYVELFRSSRNDYSTSELNEHRSENALILLTIRPGLKHENGPWVLESNSFRKLYSCQFFFFWILDCFYCLQCFNCVARFFLFGLGCVSLSRDFSEFE